MPEKFLYEQLDTLSQWGSIPKEMPSGMTKNLNPRFELRPYQVEAFARFFHCHQKDFPGKVLPLHLLFNMATGSGKTLIMAGLILYLYEKGYRNFLFFVNSTNIIQKTRDNFLNPQSSKFLSCPTSSSAISTSGSRRSRTSRPSIQGYQHLLHDDPETPQ